MKRYIYPCVFLMIAAVLSGCGDNKTTSKLIGTEMATATNSPIINSTATPQAAVVKQFLQNILPYLCQVSARYEDSSSPSHFKSILMKSKLTSSRNITESHQWSGTISGPLFGGTIIFICNNSVTITANVDSSHTGTETALFTDSISQTFTGLMVTVNGNNYLVSGAETDSVTMTQTYRLINGNPGGLTIAYSIMESKGSINIAGPGCHGTWSYSLLNKGTFSWAHGESALTGPQNVSGLLGGQYINFTNDLIFPVHFE